jgi:two-component system, cell cycle response regulator
MRIRTRVTERISQNSAAERIGGLEPACLVAIAGPLLGTRIELDGAPLTIGRSSESGLTIPHASVSRHHCRIIRDNRMFMLEDLGSTNKTFVNGLMIERTILADGDRIKLGDSVFKFFELGSVEADYQKQLVDLAVMDELTGISNRRHFLALITQEIAEARRQNMSLALIMADLDHFKPINDAHGHLDGDVVLKRFAEILVQELPPLGLAGRLGGEEFGILLPEVSVAQAKAFAESARKNTERSVYQLSNAQVNITASFGVAMLSDLMEEPTALMRAADAKLYEAKAGGRNCVAL